MASQRRAIAGGTGAPPDVQRRSEPRSYSGSVTANCELMRAFFGFTPADVMLGVVPWFQLVLELDGLVHGIERDGDGPRLEGAEVGDRELGAVLEVQRDPVARPDPAGAEPAREAIARVVELGEGDLAPVEHDGRLAWGARRVRLAEGDDRLAGELDSGLVEAGRPVLLPDPVHGRVPDTTRV